MVLGILVQQRRMTFAALLRRTPVDAADVGAPPRKQRQAELGARRRVADEGPRLHVVRHLHDCAVQQRVVAAGHQQPVRQETSVTGLQYPPVHEVSGKKPLPGHLACRDFPLADERIDFFLVDLQILGDLSHGHEPGSA